MDNIATKENAILEQWRTCVEMADSISQRRDTLNNLFVSLNLAIMATVSIVWDMKSLLMLVIGLTVCVLWFLLIRNYAMLNKAKYEVILSIEKELATQPLQNEWEILKNNHHYRDGTRLEKWLPIIFGIMYVVATVLILAS